MNYNARDDKTIPELFVMLKSTKVEIKKRASSVVIDKTTSFKKKGKGNERELQVEWQASCHSHEETQSWTKNLKLSASTAKEMVTGSGTALNTWRIRRMAK